MLPEARGLEFLIIAAIALIVVGPKELPNLLRKLGQFVGKMRRVAADFRTSFDEMAKQSELDDLRKQVEEMRAQAESSASDPMGLNSAMGEFQSGMDTDFNYGGATQTEDIVEEASPARKKSASKPKTAVKKVTSGKKAAAPAKAPAKTAAKTAAKASPKPRAAKAKS